MRNRDPSEAGVGPYVTARPARAFLAAFRAGGHSVAAVLEPFGLDESTILEPERRLSHGLLRALLERAIEVSGNPALGVDALRHGEALDLDLLDYLSATCRDRVEAVEQYNRFHRFSHEAARLSVWMEGDLAATVYEPEESLDEPPAWIDYALGWIVVFGRRVSGAEEPIVRVEFRYPQPADLRAHEAFFRAPLVFDAPRNAVVYRREDYVATHRQFDPGLRDLLARQGHLLLERMPDASRTTAEVRAALTLELADGNAGLKSIAKRLGVAPSTLRQRLHAEGTSFRALVDDERRRRAHELLDDPRRSIGEIASLLGFAYESALVRAFRRWTGMSPREYRRQRLR